MVEEVSKKPVRQSWIVLGLTALAILFLMVFLSEEMEAVRAFIHQTGWIGLFLSIGLYGLLGFTPIPSEPLTVMLSTIYGPLTATLVSGTGNLLAAVMEYMVGTHLAEIADFEKRKASLPFGLGRLPVNSALFLLGARMIPGYGPKFVSVLGGVYRVSLWRYVWTAAIPTYLGSAIFAYGGFGLLHLPIFYK